MAGHPRTLHQQVYFAQHSFVVNLALFFFSCSQPGYADQTAYIDVNMTGHCFQRASLSPLLQPMGASDYLEMARIFDTVFIRHVPKLTLTLKDQARRFITLIDNFYDHKVNSSDENGCKRIDAPPFNAESCVSNIVVHEGFLNFLTCVENVLFP